MFSSDGTMRRLIGIVLLSAALPGVGAGQQLPRTPAQGSPERTAILDAVRPALEGRVNAHVTFADVRLSVHDGWAYLRAIPYAREESREEFRSDLRIPCENCDPFVYALLRQGPAGWRVLESQAEALPTTSPLAGWLARHGAPAALSYRGPDEAALEAAMREYIDALAVKDDQRFVALLACNTPVRVVNGISFPSKDTITVTAAEVARDFRSRGGLYFAFFGDLDPVTGEKRDFDYYAERFLSRGMWRRDGGALYVDPWDPLDARIAQYVKWKREGGRWVVEEIGVLWS